MPAETIAGGSAPQIVRQQSQTNQVPPPQSAPPPEPTKTEQRIKELEEQIKKLQQMLADLKDAQERALVESTGQLLLANALRISEDSQRDDGPPVDEFDNNSIYNKQAFSMSDALSYRSLSKAREAVYGDAVGEIKGLSNQIEQLQDELDALKKPT